MKWARIKDLLSTPLLRHNSVSTFFAAVVIFLDVSKKVFCCCCWRNFPLLFVISASLLSGYQDTQHNTTHNNDIQHSSKNMTLSAMAVDTVCYAKCLQISPLSGVS
jgi:hypothetical protein